MTWWELVLRGLRWRWFASLVNVLSVALGTGAVCIVLVVQADLQARFEEPGRSYGLVVGAMGSPQQLVLNAVFHVDESPGVMPLVRWRELHDHPSTALAVPYAVGDSFRGHRVVATTEAFFDPRFPHPAGNDPQHKLQQGRPLRRDTTRDDGHTSEPREAVIGATVHDTLGVRVGDRIELAHGFEDAASAHTREHLWDVVGILKPTGTPLDDIVLINLDAFLAMDDHTDGSPGLSALLVFPRRGVHTARLMAELRRRPDVQVAHVGTEVRRLSALVGRVDTLFLLVALLVLVVAVLSVFSSTIVSTHGRRGHLGLLRALGCSRRTVLGLVVAEAAMLALFGAMVGLLGAHATLFVTRSAINSIVGFHPDPFALSWSEGAVIGLVTLAGAVAGLLPGLRAYRVDVAATLRETT